MMAWIDGLPLLWSIGFFWMLAILRTLIVFSLGRGLASGVERTRWFARVMEGPVYVRAQRFIQRHGVWAIPFCPRSARSCGAWCTGPSEWPWCGPSSARRSERAGASSPSCCSSRPWPRSSSGADAARCAGTGPGDVVVRDAGRATPPGD